MDKPIDIEHIRDLVMEEIGEVISEEDRLYLHEIIRESPEAKLVADEVWAYFNQPHIRQAYDHFKAHASFEDVIQRSARLQKSAGPQKTSTLRRLSIAASVAILLTVSVFSYRYFTRPEAVAANKKAIQVKLASGQVVAVSDTKGNVQLGGLTLHSQNQTLQYTSTGQKEQLTVTVPIGMDYHVNLPDGSAIYLNAGTTLQFPSIFADNSREITIDGEAYLQVAPVPGKPFTVHLPAATIQVLGTEFNVNTYNTAHSQISLVAGAIKIYNSTDSTILKPGLQASFSGVSSPIAVDTFDQGNTLSWRKGLYVLHDASLQELTAVIPRWYGLEVVVDPGANNDIVFSGVLDKHEPLDTFLSRLHHLTDIDSYKKDGVLHLK